MRADIHGGQEHSTLQSEAGYIDARPQADSSTKASCNARPHHTFGSSLCENVQEPTTRRIIFSIALFPIAASVLFLFRLAKSRRTFYAPIERLCFHTGSVGSSLSMAVVGASEDPCWDRQQIDDQPEFRRL